MWVDARRCRLCRIADMLPKHWGEPVGGGEVAEQLAAKQLSHNSLLLILSAAGVLQQLPPPVLRCALPSTSRGPRPLEEHASQRPQTA